MIALLYDIKILPVGSLDYSQSTRVTDGQTDGQNYDSQDQASIAASRGKNCYSVSTVIVTNRTVVREIAFEDVFNM